MVRWILEKEDNETLLMKYCPATGGRPESWKIRQGNYITLGELFVFGVDRCSCWDLYRTYTAWEIFIRRKPHSLSNSDDAIFRANAERSKFEKKLTGGVFPIRIHVCSVRLENRASGGECYARSGSSGPSVGALVPLRTKLRTRNQSV